MTDKAFVLGLDGVPWQLVAEWSNDGELPNFANIIQNGAGGPLDSTRPATTPVAWPSISTGVRADTHGLYGFHKLSSDYSHRMNTSADIDAPALWEMVSPAVVANVPMTYPASSIDGTMVCGMIAPEINDQFTYPPSFRDELEEQIPEYRISLPWDEYADDREAFLSDFDDLVSARRELMRLLMNRTTDWELFFFVYTSPDRLQHLFWGEDVMLEHYKEIDDILGEVMEYVSAVGGNLYVVSDHGFGPIERQVHVNSLLREAGYLTEKEPSGMRGLLDSLGVTRASITNRLKRLGIGEYQIISIFSRDVVDRVAQQLPGDHVLYDVDFDNTVAFFHLVGAVYINDRERFDAGVVEPESVPSIKAELMEIFEELTDPETGEQGLVVYDGSELFPRDHRSPDLLVSGKPGYTTHNELRSATVTDTENKTADHRTEGIFLAWGPSIESQVAPRNATVYDIGPTVLHSLGRPVPERCDGRVLSEIFTESSRASESPVETAQYSSDRNDIELSDDFQDVEDRLRGLGYLG